MARQKKAFVGKLGEQEYKFRITSRRAEDLEQKLGCNPMVIIARLEEAYRKQDITALFQKAPTDKEIALILHSALQEFQHGVSLDDVYDLIDEYVDEGHSKLDLINLISEILMVSGYTNKPEEQVEEGQEQ